MLKRQLAITFTNVDPLHIEAWTKWVPSCMRYIQLYILNGIYLHFDWNVTDFFPHRYNWCYVTIGSGTYLAPYWWQAIGCSSDDQNFAAIWSLGLNELKYLWAWDQRRQLSWCQDTPCCGHTKGICGSAWVSLDKGVYHTDVNINCHAKNLMKYVGMNRYSVIRNTMDITRTMIYAIIKLQVFMRLLANTALLMKHLTQWSPGICMADMPTITHFA